MLFLLITHNIGWGPILCTQFSGDMINGSLFRALALLSLLVGVLFAVGAVGAVTVPTSVTSYLPITIQNTQAVAFPSNAQIPISFNALAYQSYESNSLNNTDFFFANGTIIPSWLEGNTLNENGASKTSYTRAPTFLFWNRICSNETSSALLAQTRFILDLLEIEPAQQHNNWKGATNILQQPGQHNPGCAAGQYGQYDDGANVFALYDGFSGTSLNGRWTEWDSSAGTLAVSNSLSLTATSTSHAFGVYVAYTPPQQEWTQKHTSLPLIRRQDTGILKDTVRIAHQPQNKTDT